MKKQIIFFVSFLSFCFAITIWAGVAEDRQLIDAIRANNPVAAQAAIEAGADVNQRVINGNTPLHLAILNPISPERKEIIMLLVRNGARVNTRNNTDQLPADLARAMPDFEDIQTLLGFDDSCAICALPITPEEDFVRGSNLFGCDPRHIFHRACLFNEAGIQRTVQCPTCRTTRDETAAAAERDALLAHYTATEAHPDAEETHPDAATLTPTTEALLINAARDGNLAQVEALLTAGADVNAPNNGWTALMWAAHNGHTEIVDTLLAHGANVNATTTVNGETALITAAYEGHTEIVNILLTHGANVHATGREGETALMWAAGNNNVEVVNTLLAHGANVDATENRGLTALIFAAWHNRTEIVNILLAHGANVNATTTGGQTALMWAANSNHIEVVNTLLAHGANVDATDTFGLTALDSSLQNSEIERLLIAHGARVSWTRWISNLVRRIIRRDRP